MGLNPNSTFKFVNNVNPFRSRSTVICIACLMTLVIIDGMAMYSGYFNVEFASLSIFVLREMIGAVFGHQLKADENKTDSEKTTVSMSASTPPPLPKP